MLNGSLTNWKNAGYEVETKVNTPVTDANYEMCIRDRDAAVIVVSGKAGVEVGTEKAWELCDKYNLPRMVYVTEMDVDDASFRQVVQDLTDKYGKVIAPHFQPIRENEKLVGYVNIIKNAGRRYTGIGAVSYTHLPQSCEQLIPIPGP